MEKNLERKGETHEDFRHIVRIANTDLDGRKKIGNALRKIRGIHFMFANAVCKVSGIDPNIPSGNLSEAEVRKIDEIMKNPQNYGIPEWMFNRRKDYETGGDIHLTSSDVKIIQENDVKRMRMIKAYKGVRSAFGLTVRGQRTRSNFRKNKGKVVGVIKSKITKTAIAEKEKEGKK